MSIYKSIAEALPRGELLAQLAEECGELGAAALKLRRAEEKINPTPVSLEEAQDHFIEEIADVYVTVDAVMTAMAAEGRTNQLGEIFMIMEYKRNRWANRLRVAQGECADACPISGDVDRGPAEQEPPRM